MLIGGYHLGRCLRCIRLRALFLTSLGFHATGRPLRFAIALKDTDRLIGGCGLDGSTGDGSDEPALGYWLGQPYWGQGFTREAVAVLIEYISAITPMLPGDVIFTGTPSGVGSHRTPPRYLVDGDEVVTRIERIRELSQTFRAR